MYIEFCKFAQQDYTHKVDAGPEGEMNIVLMVTYHV